MGLSLPTHRRERMANLSVWEFYGTAGSGLQAPVEMFAKVSPMIPIWAASGHHRFDNGRPERFAGSAIAP